MSVQLAALYRLGTKNALSVTARATAGQSLVVCSWFVILFRACHIAVTARCDCRLSQIKNFDLDKISVRHCE
jgi:hypothetical protein